ncbi:type II secretion system protein [Geobacter pickeringii]|uniref:type II secretion system protein n=1 Tax=Geobacter pickeringii TaxID=345632 RepID=UPI000B1449FF|nr:type II secretion system protein [Geobacter pickeringii]
MRILRSVDGFTYLAAIMIVVIMGIMLGVSGQLWRTTMKREREEELLFRGQQYKAAMERWYKPGGPGQPPPSSLNDLKDLLKDPHSTTTVRYIRRLYKDPVTGKDFDVVRQPGKGIVGVMSTSEDEPLKAGGFPKGLEALEGANQYKKWLFALSLDASGKGGTTGQQAGGGQSASPGQAAPAGTAGMPSGWSYPGATGTPAR